MTEIDIQTAPVKKRLFAALIDCAFIPSFVGMVISVLFMLGSSGVGNMIVLIFLLVWFSAKDLMFDGSAPGKKIFGLRVVSSVTGEKVTLAQGFIRNVLFILPLVAVFGFPFELIMLLMKGERLGDRWARTKVVSV